MKKILTDVLILAGISGIVACAMLLPPKTMCRLEKNKGVVIYDAPITKEQATKVLNVLVEFGIFNGSKAQTHLLKYDSEDGVETVVWSMATDPNFASVLSDLLLQDGVSQLHSMVFSNNRALVEMTDEVVAQDDRTQQILTDWGAILYDPPIKKLDAQRVAQTLTQIGGYSGTIRMQTEGRNLKYHVQRDPASHEFVRDSMASEMQELVLKSVS